MQLHPTRTLVNTPTLVKQGIIEIPEETYTLNDVASSELHLKLVTLRALDENVTGDAYKKILKPEKITMCKRV